MTPWRNRQISVLLAAGYGLAVSVSGFFHDHGDAGHACSHAPASAAHSHADHPGHPESPSRPSSPQPCPDGQHCVVCHFLAQKTLAADPAEEVTSVGMIDEVAVAAPVRPVAALTPSWHSRAPPDVA